MLENPWNGEVTIRADGQIKRLRLTLGAMASLEAALGVNSLPAIIERLAENEFSAEDLIAILDAGLIGGGYEAGIATMEIEGGGVTAARAAMALILRAFPGAKLDDAI